MSKKPRVMIGIEIDGQKLVLDEEAARGLYETLDGMFGKKVVKEKEYISYPYPVYPPYWSTSPYWSSGTIAIDTTKPYCTTVNVDSTNTYSTSGNGMWTLTTTTGSDMKKLAYTPNLEGIYVY